VTRILFLFAFVAALFSLGACATVDLSGEDQAALTENQLALRDAAETLKTEADAKGWASAMSMGERTRNFAQMLFHGADEDESGDPGAHYMVRADGDVAMREDIAEAVSLILAVNRAAGQIAVSLNGQPARATDITVMEDAALRAKRIETYFKDASASWSDDAFTAELNRLSDVSTQAIRYADLFADGDPSVATPAMS